MDARISFIVPVYNGERFIGGCLDAILAECRLGDEVIVVDNGSTDGTPDIVRGYPDVRRLARPECTVGAVRNAGAQAAGGTLLAFIDADCLLAPGWRAAAVDGLVDSQVCAVGSRVDLPGKPGWIEKAWFTQKRRRPGRVRYINSGNLVIRAAVFRSAGGFDEALESGEDAELGWRLRAAGYQLQEIPAVRVVHLGGPKSLRGFYRQQRWHGMGMLGTFRVNRCDKPLIMTLGFIGCLVGAGGFLLFQGETSSVLAVLIVLAMLLAVPTVTAAYRCLEFGGLRSFPQLIVLYLLYFTARAEACGRILFQAVARNRQGA